MRCTFSGNYFFHIESTMKASYAYDNALRDITFEVSNGGCAKLLSTFNSTIDNCNVYDLDGPAKRDLFYIGKTPSSPPSFNTQLRSVQRRAGRLSSGIHDIKLAPNSARDTIVQNCTGTSGSGYSIDLGGNQALLLGSSKEDTVVRADAAQLVGFVLLPTALRNQKSFD